MTEQVDFNKAERQLFHKAFREMNVSANRKLVAKNAKWSYVYAFFETGKPFPDGEDAIATDSHYATLYACNVLGKPFPKGEKTILADRAYCNTYKAMIKKPDWVRQHNIKLAQEAVHHG